VCDLWARAVEGKRDELAQCIERLLGVPDDGHIARAYYRWLPDKLREAYDRAAERVARQQWTASEGVREGATSAPPASAVGARVTFVRSHTQTPLSPDEIAELRRLDEEAGAAIERPGREVFAVVTPGTNYGHFCKCKVPYYTPSPHVPLSPNEGKRPVKARCRAGKNASWTWGASDPRSDTGIRPRAERCWPGALPPPVDSRPDAVAGHLCGRYV
jgi:hypothetical protein